MFNNYYKQRNNVLFRLCLILSISMLMSCAAPQRALDQDELLNSYQSFIDQYQRELTALAKKSERRLQYEYLDNDKYLQSYDVLVLSGGGELGAFGAGFLQGWGTVEQGEFKRPKFDSVSGISTGALIAPFAFVGTEKAYETIVDLYRNPDEDFAIARGLLNFLFGNRSYYDVKKLHERIDQSITPELVQQIAAGSREHRSLVVGATNLDYGILRAWDLSEVAAGTLTLDINTDISTRLIASSAIPAVFPPVEINEHLYVDGGASLQVVSGLDNRSWLYGDNTSQIDFVDTKRPLRIRVWVIVNNKLLLEPELTQVTWSNIATRSLSSLMRASTLQSLQDMETLTQMIDLRPEFDAQMYYVAIPADYQIPQTKNLFDAEKMRGLVELGYKMGADSNNWKRRALLPGAPINQ